jgi:hypothetical protein
MKEKPLLCYEVRVTTPDSEEEQLAGTYWDVYDAWWRCMQISADACRIIAVNAMLDNSDPINPKHSLRTDIIGYPPIQQIHNSSGTEGPRSDPYHYDEWDISLPGYHIEVHLGLAEWIKVNGTRLVEFDQAFDKIDEYVKSITGKDLREIEAQYRFWHWNDEPDPMGPASRYE